MSAFDPKRTSAPFQNPYLTRYDGSSLSLEDRLVPKKPSKENNDDFDALVATQARKSAVVDFMAEVGPHCDREALLADSSNDRRAAS